jgi:hypothetical protein
LRDAIYPTALEKGMTAAKEVIVTICPESLLRISGKKDFTI